MINASELKVSQSNPLTNYSRGLSFPCLILANCHSYLPNQFLNSHGMNVSLNSCEIKLARTNTYSVEKKTSTKNVSSKFYFPQKTGPLSSSSSTKKRCDPFKRISKRTKSCSSMTFGSTLRENLRTKMVSLCSPIRNPTLNTQAQAKSTQTKATLI